MEQISNKTLMFLLIVTIIVSIGSTIISLNKVNRLVSAQLTGMATTSTGKVNVTIGAVSSITVVSPAVIDFGSCSPNASTGSNVSSNISTDWGAPGVCAGSAAPPDNLTVQNDGNKNANVTVKTNVIAGSTFIGGTDPGFYFSARNGSNRAGCNNLTVQNPPSGFSGTTGMQLAWKSFAAAGTEYLACANLTYSDTNDQFSLFVLLDLPPDAPTSSEQNATLTLTAVSH